MNVVSPKGVRSPTLAICGADQICLWMLGLHIGFAGIGELRRGMNL